MNKRIAHCLLLASSLAIESTSARAEDIDIYSQNPNITPGAPNVLIVLDNTANWSQSFAGDTKFSAEKVALAQVITALKAQFNLGIMMYTETGGGNSGPDGGYVRFAIQGMTDGNGNATNARNCLLTMIGQAPTPACSPTLSPYYTNLDIINDKSNGGKAGVTMGEAYDYFSGITAYAGKNKTKADPGAFTSQTIAGPTYAKPDEDGTCVKNFIIVISNGPFQDNTSDTSTAMSQLGAAGGDTTIINPPDTASNNNAGDEWVRWLHDSPLSVVTYTLEVGPSTTGQGPYNTRLLQSMGSKGKGGYFSAFDASQLQAALTRIFNDIQAKNSVFASSSLPLAADNTGNFANQVYMAVFRPDGSGLPRWVGNLKQYKFAPDGNNNLILVDADGVAAAAARTGFAKSGSRSFWTSTNTGTAPDATFVASTNATDGSTGGFWYYDAKGDGGAFDSPDGEWVEKGGAAQQLRLAHLGYGGRGGVGDTNAAASSINGSPPRQVYTCTGGCLTTGALLSGSPFDSSNTVITADPSQFGINPGAVTVSSISSDRVVATITAGTALPSVSSLVATSTQVTITTSKNHGLPNGTSYVTIDGSSITGTNGTFLVTNTGNKTFTYVVTGVTAGTSSGTPTATSASNTATVKTPTPHGFANGMAVKISQANCPAASAGLPPSVPNCAFNGTGFTVANKQPNTFTITLPGNGVGASATGAPLASVMIARVTTTTPHGYSTGDSVTIANATCSPTACAEYNTTGTIFNLTPTSFDYLYSASAPLPVANNTGITSTDNTGSSATLLTMLKWVRGQDTQNENNFQVGTADTDVRASIHGDILHSRPVVLNYADTGAATNNVYLFYGGNDGVFRAIKGGQAATDGKEQWAFIPTEFFPILKRQYDNSPPVLYPTTPSGLGATRRSYAFDGPVVPYVERNGSGVIQKVYLYISVRRGGRFIYALDVTTPTTPKFLWRKGCTTTGGTTTCDAGFEELGQTWSAPAVIKVQAHTNPVLIFGGGYDAASEDPEPPALTDQFGRMIYVVDAFDGSIVWSAGNAGKSTPSVTVSGMDFSIAADVLAVDRKQTGLVDRAYTADVGGNVWRVDMGGSDTSSWAVWKIASVGGRTAASAGRKFLFGPDVVFGTAGTFDAVVIGSGDREHPLSTNAASGIPNRAYMFMDPNTGTTGSNVNITESDLADVSASSTGPVNLTGKKGWSVTLRGGEQVVNGPIVVASSMVFGTNQSCASGEINETTGECTTGGGTLTCTGNLGVARRYDINFLTTEPAGFTVGTTAVKSLIADGGGFLPSPVAGVVEVNGQNYPFITDNPLSPGGVLNPVINVSNKRFRTYWHEVLE